MNGTQPYSRSKTRRARSGTGMWPFASTCSHTVQNSRIVTDHTSMHHGHRVPSEKKLWPMSQMQNASAPATPIANAIQNQRAKRAPASIATPDRDRSDEPAETPDRVRHAEEHLALPGLEVHAALHEQAEVAVEIGARILEQLDLVEDERERRVPPEHAGDDEHDRHRDRRARSWLSVGMHGLFHARV